MRMMSGLRFGVLLGVVGWAGGLCGQAPAGTVDPLAVGKSAMAHGDHAGALKFFQDYAAQNPGSTEALFYAATQEYELNLYPAAVVDFKKVIAAKPTLWNAHNNLAIVYAQQEDWADFDAERKIVADARAQHAAGMPAQGNDVIDVLHVNGQQYVVRMYDPGLGRFHTKYRFIHFDSANKADMWIDCESDDLDQSFFAKDHPQEAAAGNRSYSLDSYTAVSVGANGQRTQTHGTIKFYKDGEPKYETVRADVLGVLQKQSGVMSSTTVTTPGEKK